MSNFFCCCSRSAIFLSGHVPCKFFFYSNIFFGRGERERGGGVKIGSVCVSP